MNVHCSPLNVQLHLVRCTVFGLVATILISIFPFISPSLSFYFILGKRYSAFRRSAHTYDFFSLFFSQKVFSNLKIEELIVWLVNMNKRKNWIKKRMKKSWFSLRTKSLIEIRNKFDGRRNRRLSLLYCHDTFAFLFSKCFFPFLKEILICWNIHKFINNH